MIISGLLLIILYISHRYIVAWIIYYNNQDERFGNSIWRWTYDYKLLVKEIFQILMTSLL